MSRLYVRVMTGFYSHRKTVRLKLKIGSDAYWIPPKLWAFCAENQPDGDISAYSSEEIAESLGCLIHATSIKQALTECGFVDKNGTIHDWAEHNGYHDRFANRAKKAAEARWAKKRENPPTPLKEKDIGNRTVDSGVSIAKHFSSNATSIKTLESYIEIESRTGKLFNRPTGTPSSYAEQSAISEISRRPDVLKELVEIENFHTKPENYFPQSLQKLLSTWQETLDRARTHEARKEKNGKPIKPNPRNNGVAQNAADQGRAIAERIASRQNT